MIAIADCNSFYCSCERLFRPDLIGKPIVVLSNNDGCIVSRTDEAKQLGIDMAVPYFQCKEIMEKYGVTVFSSNYHLYGDMSMRVMNIFRSIIGAEYVEVYSVDEAFLHVDHIPEKDLYNTALHLKHYTERCTGIPICVGIGPNKLLSKVANKLAKKNKAVTKGVMVLRSDYEIEAALQNFKVGDLWGIGRRYADKLQTFGIENAWQLRNMPLEWVRKNLGGVVGLRLARQLRGESISVMNEPLEVKKMIATTRMFGRFVTELKDIEEAIATYTARAAEKLRRQSGAAGELSVFLLYQDTLQKEYTVRSMGSYELLPVASSDTVYLTKIALRLVNSIFKKGLKYKKGGVLLSRIVADSALQANLFTENTPTNKALMLVLDNINSAIRPDMVVMARAGINKHWKMRQELRSPKFTTVWGELMVVK